MTKDYLASRTMEPGDKVDYGVPGMKWGIRRTAAQLAKSKNGSSDSGDKTDAPKKTASSGEETSPQRYDRIAKQAKAGAGKDLSDEDLKWFNARTEALVKVNRLNEQRPGWLKEATSKAVKNAASNAINNVTGAVTDKYINVPIANLIKGVESKPTPTFEQRVKDAAKKKVELKKFNDAVEKETNNILDDETD